MDAAGCGCTRTPGTPSQSSVCHTGALLDTGWSQEMDFTADSNGNLNFMLL